MKSKNELKELIKDQQQLKLNFLKMMMDFVEKSRNVISADDKEDLLLLYLFLESL